MIRALCGVLVLVATAGCGSSSSSSPGGGGAAPPTLTGFAPASGSPGTSVVLTGTGLASPTAVTFDGVAAQLSLTPTDTSLTVTIPDGATTGPIAVTTRYGTATSASSFTVPPPFWTAQSSGSTRSLLAVAWSGSTFAAVGENGEALTSPDAVTWTHQFTSTSSPLFGVAASPSLFVAVGGSAGSVLLTSPDGVAWTSPTLTYAQCHPPPGPPPVGVACTETSSSGFHAVVWTGTQFVAIGALGCTGGSNLNYGFYGYASATGAACTWTGNAGNATGLTWALGWSGTQFVALGGNSCCTGFYNPQCPCTGVFQVVNNVADVSSDGVNWSGFAAPDVGATTVTGIAWAAPLGRLAAVGYGGAVLLSSDGRSWQMQSAATTADLYGVAWGGSQFVAVGKGGATLTSPDGMTWTVENSGTGKDINAVVWSGSKLVAVGYQGLVLTSP